MGAVYKWMMRPARPLWHDPLWFEDSRIQELKLELVHTKLVFKVCTPTYHLMNFWHGTPEYQTQFHPWSVPDPCQGIRNEQLSIAPDLNISNISQFSPPPPILPPLVHHLLFQVFEVSDFFAGVLFCSLVCPRRRAPQCLTCQSTASLTTSIE